MKAKIDFCVVGPQRTSTTWIYEKLLKSKQVNLPTKVKETFFFDQKFSKGFSYYFSLFEDFDSNLITGEIGPTYFHSLDAAERIHNSNNKCKIIFIYRDPVEKSISLYQHHYRKGRVGKDFKKAIIKRPDIVETSRYSVYSKIWEDLFSNENVLMVRFNDLKYKPQEFLDEITSFLGLERIIVKENDSKKVNQSTVPKYRILAKIFAFFAAFMRKYDYHVLAEFGKKIGLKKVFEGGKEHRNFIYEKEWIKTQFVKQDFK
jgi:hypothetical protein